jgi:hypothetical protein
MYNTARNNINPIAENTYNFAFLIFLLISSPTYLLIQILTIEDLFRGKKPETPPTISAFHEAPLTQRTPKDKQQTLFT